MIACDCLQGQSSQNEVSFLEVKTAGALNVIQGEDKEKVKVKAPSLRGDLSAVKEKGRQVEILASRQNISAD